MIKRDNQQPQRYAANAMPVLRTKTDTDKLNERSERIQKAYKIAKAQRMQKKALEKVKAQKFIEDTAVFNKTFKRFANDNDATIHFYFVFCAEWMFLSEKRELPLQMGRDFTDFTFMFHTNEQKVIEKFGEYLNYAVSDFAFWCTFEHFRRENFNA